jgi:hypothetical protein
MFPNLPSLLRLSSPPVRDGQLYFLAPFGQSEKKWPTERPKNDPVGHVNDGYEAAGSDPQVKEAAKDKISMITRF